MHGGMTDPNQIIDYWRTRVADLEQVVAETKATATGVFYDLQGKDKEIERLKGNMKAVIEALHPEYSGRGTPEEGVKALLAEVERLKKSTHVLGRDRDAARKALDRLADDLAEAKRLLGETQCYCEMEGCRHCEERIAFLAKQKEKTMSAGQFMSAEEFIEELDKRVEARVRAYPDRPELKSAVYTETLRREYEGLRKEVQGG